MHVIPSWDSFVDTDEFKSILKKVMDKEITMTDVLVIFSTGHRYGEIKSRAHKS